MTLKGETMAFVTELSIEAFKDIHEPQKKNWIYRGQRNFSWHIETSLERACEAWELPLTKAMETEELLIREFKRRFHLYTTDLPEDKAYIEWLSIMQHHGSPTRLLDFSYSFYVAAYFALEQPSDVKTEKGSAVFAINGKWLSDEMTRVIPDTELTKKPTSIKIEKHLHEIVTRKSRKPFVVPVNPFRMSQRLTTQKGIFMCPGDITKSFEENLNSFTSLEKKENIFKLLIPNSKRRKILDILINDMNIDRTTLFPGLDGFAQSLTVSLPIYFAKRN